VDVLLHWSWFVVALFEINARAGKYSSMTWNVLEYLALFLIVLLHEYGHALACRRVGGIANRIVLWPLGGVAYVDPPPRPGATLWSIAAGPLVNVALLPIFVVLYMVSQASGWAQTMPDAHRFLVAVGAINLVLLIFNILPVYPLDGGQIVRALLWFVLGRARSLMVATLIGFLGVAGLIILAVRIGSAWFGILSVFIVLNCWGGLKQSIGLMRLAKLPHREGFACPWCKTSPPVGTFWRCDACQTILDVFEVRGLCPHCGDTFAAARCFHCGKSNPVSEWIAPAYAGSKA
jgi:Zn-dependent protease